MHSGLVDAGNVQPEFEPRHNRKTRRRNRKKYRYTTQGWVRALRTPVLSIVFVFAGFLIVGSLSRVLQYGLDMASVTVGLLAVLCLALSVYFSPVPHKLSVLFRNAQTVKRRQARHHLRHLKKVNRLVHRIDQGAAYHLGADGEIILDKTAKHEVDGGNEG